MSPRLERAGLATVAGALGLVLGLLVAWQTVAVGRPEWELHLANERAALETQAATLARVESAQTATLAELLEVRAELRAMRPGPRAR